MKRIIGIGNALVDIITLIENDDVLKTLHLPKGSMQLVDSEKSESIKNKVQADRSMFFSGGSAANTIHGLGKLGTQCAFIGKTGCDNYGDVFNDEMKNAGVKTFLLRSETTSTGIAVALVTPDSERTFATYLGAAVELKESDILFEMLKDFDILYIEGYLMTDADLIRGICRMAKANNMEIAIDLASYNVVEEFQLVFEEIIHDYVDIVFANEEEAQAFTGKEAEDAIVCMADMCKTAVVKTGEKGSLIRQGEKQDKIGILPVKSIDTTGAGDLYAAGFLYGYAKDLPLYKCGLIGTTLASKVIGVLGSKINDDTWPEIKKAIALIEEK